MTASAFVTVEELAAFAQRDAASGDPTAQLMVELATGAVKRITGQDIELVEGDEVKIDGATRNVVFLPQIPVIAVHEVSVLVSTTETPLVEVDDYTWDRKGALRRIPDWTLWRADRQGVLVTYDHGYEDIPPDIRLVVLSLAAKLWANPTGVSAERSLTYSGTFSELLSPDEMAILDTYRLSD